jgi:hypothetical protein
MPSLADTPVHPVAIVRTAVARDLHMPGNRHLLMRVEIDGLRASGRRRKGPTGAGPMPIPLNCPSDGLGRVSSVCPAAELDPGEMVEPCIDGLAHPDAVVVRPAPDFGVELIDDLTLGQRLGASNDLPKRCEMLLDVDLGRFDQGLIYCSPLRRGALELSIELIASFANGPNLL